MLVKMRKERSQPAELLPPPRPDGSSGAGSGSPLPAALLEGGQDGQFVARVRAEAAGGRSPPVGIRVGSPHGSGPEAGRISARLDVSPTPLLGLLPPTHPLYPRPLSRWSRKVSFPNFSKVS